MELDWKEIDRWIFGEAWTGSKVGVLIRPVDFQSPACVAIGNI